MTKTRLLQKTFLQGEAWMLTVQGAFQRANVYNEHANDKERETFRDALRRYVEDIVHQYRQPVSGEQHLKNILSLMKYCKTKHTKLLANDELRFGVAQKVLNLYLKYLWCLGEVAEPPHFPVDRQIQLKMGKKEHEIISWTKDLDQEAYMSIIREASSKAGERNESLASWELRSFQEVQNGHPPFHK